MSEINIQVKQQYLRENIIEAGYDPQNFLEFCSKTHDLDDLQNWSMQELITIVHNFIAQHQSREAKIQTAAQEDQFGEFHKPAEHIHPTQESNVNPAPETKIGLVFSDDDWKHFLSEPSVLGTTNSGTTSTHIPNDLLFDISGPLSTSKPKEGPLSPPSIMQQAKIKSQIVPQSLKKVEKFPLQEKPEAMLDIKNVDNSKKQSNAINLSNIKICTAKQKLQPLLPLINDVVVTKTEQVSRSFLQSDFTLYHISFPPTQHVVKRKFTDLRKVRNILQKFYPFLRLPYLQAEGWMSSSEGRDPETLAKYKWMVEEFIRYVLLKSKQLKDCELVRILCGFSLNGQKDDLKKKIESLQQASKPKFIGEVVLTDNSFVIPPVCSCDRLVNNTTSLFAQIDIQYEKLRKQIDSLFSTYDILTKNYSDISSTFQVLQSLTKKYNFDNNQPADIRLYQGLKEMTTKMASKITGESSIFKTKIKNLILYEKHNMTTLKEIFQNRNKVHYEFQRQGNPPFSSNSMRVQGANVQIQSPVPLDDPVRNNKNTLALQQAFWSFMVQRETSRYWQHLRRKISEHLTLIAYDELDCENQNLNFWNSMIKRCVI